MKNKKLKIIIATVLILTASCNEPETVITDIVHSDGSITRRIEIKNKENKFEVSGIQVPFDNTWSIRDSLEININGDTIWVKRAEKLFKSADEINRDYESDSSANREMLRRAVFNKKFRWFHTGYRFAETIDKQMLYGYPVSDFLTSEELGWFYSPDNVNEQRKNGPDSLKFRALSDTVNKRTDKWWIKSIVSEWIGEFTKLIQAKAGRELSADSLKAHEDEFVKRIEIEGGKFDSLWANGTILREFIGEANALKYRKDADSSMNIATKKVFTNFKDYTLRIVMPGKVTGSNGFIDSTGVLLWPIKSDYFLSESYEMWAESKVPNRWAWILSGFFLLFVVTGIIIKQKEKG